MSFSTLHEHKAFEMMTTCRKKKKKKQICADRRKNLIINNNSNNKRSLQPHLTCSSSVVEIFLSFSFFQCALSLTPSHTFSIAQQHSNFPLRACIRRERMCYLKRVCGSELAIYSTTSHFVRRAHICGRSTQVFSSSIAIVFRIGKRQSENKMDEKLDIETMKISFFFFVTFLFRSLLHSTLSTKRF